MEKFKESSARIVLFREFGILNSATLENSFLYRKRVLEECNSEDEDGETYSEDEVTSP